MYCQVAPAGVMFLSLIMLIDVSLFLQVCADL